MADDHSQDIGLTRTEGHPNPDFLRALRHAVGNHTVDADGGEQQRGHREHRQQRHRDATLCHRLGHDLPHRPNVGHRERGILFTHDRDHGVRNRTWIAGRPQRDGHARIGEPRIGPERHRARRFVQARVPDVADDADDLVVTFVVPGDSNLATDGILAGEILLGHRLVDDDAILTVGRVVLVEQPSLQQRNAHRLEEVPGHDAHVRHWFLATWRRRLANDLEARGRTEAAQGNEAVRSGCLDSGQGLDAIEQSTEELHALSGLSVPRSRQRHTHRNRLCRVEPGIDVHQLNEAANEQASAGEQYERQSHFDNDERAARAAAT